MGYYLFLDHPNWTVLMIARFIPYHIGEFAVTGAGKSLLTRFQILPFLVKNNYDLIILDWRGSDYAPHFKKTLYIGDLALDEDNVVDHLCAAMDDFGYYSRDYTERNPIKAALEIVIYQSQWRKMDAPAKLCAFLEAHVELEIRNKETSGGLTLCLWEEQP